MLNRRQLLSALPAPFLTAARADEVPAPSGQAVPEMTSFDEHIGRYLREQKAPGGAVAVARHGKLLYARGFGWADVERRTPVMADSLFRIASVSKPITGLAMMALLEDGTGKVQMSTPVRRFLDLDPYLPSSKSIDPRIDSITVEHLLHHSGGWDRSRSRDLMFQHFQVASDLKIPSPPDHASLLRWSFGRRLDFDPGTKEAYSNFGYCVLGRVIEKATGQPYETYVRRRILARAGIRKMRIGAGRRTEQAEGEVTYYDPDRRRGKNVFSQDPEREAPLPYAFASPKTMDAHGGWIASMVDLVRLGSAVEQSDYPLLSKRSVEQLFDRPPAPLGRTPEGEPTPFYYGCGWSVRVLPNGTRNTWHDGGMPGTGAILVRLASGLVWAAAFNARVDGVALDKLLHTAAREVKNWPFHDLFSAFG